MVACITITALFQGSVFIDIYVKLSDFHFALESTGKKRRVSEEGYNPIAKMQCFLGHESFQKRKL